MGSVSFGYCAESALLVGLSCLFLFLWIKSKRDLAVRTAKFHLQLNALDKTIHQAKNQLEATFDSIADGIAVIDPDYRITRLNRTYAELTGQNISSSLGQKCYRSLRGLDKPCPECPISNMRYHDGLSCMIKTYKVQIEVTPTVTEGTVQNYIETVRDVTRFENLHTQLRRSERLATIGTMVAGIAHEMNNPLSGISGNSQLMLRTPAKYGLNEKGESRVLEIFNSVKRATQIINDLLEFSRPSGTQFRRLDLQSLFAQAQTRIADNNLSLFSIENSFPSEHLFVWGNKSQLESVLEKILLNGIQAIQEKRRNTPELRGRLAVSGRLEGNNIIAEIRDNGCGISEGSLASLFDPFFTTKDPGCGVGLGLSLCHRIISEHFGSIKMKQRKEGTLVQIYFPVDKPQIA